MNGTSPYGTPMTSAPQPPKKRHPVRIGCLSLIGVVVLIIIIVAIVAGTSGSKPATTTTPPAAAASSAAASTAPAAKAASLGTPVRDGKFQFTVISVSQAKSVGDTADDLGDTAQGEYTILHLTVKNISTEPQTLDDSAQAVFDSTGRKYDASTDADIDLDSANGTDSVFLNDINPGNTVDGQIAFDMPAGVKAVKAVLHDSVFSGGVTVTLP